MRGYSKVPNFLIFLVQSIPSPTICDGPLSLNWARVFSVLILFINLIFLLRSNQYVFCLLLREKVAEGRMRGYSKVPNFLIFLVQSIPSPTVFNGPPSPSWARVFESLIFFINLIFMLRSNQFVFCLLLREKVAEGRMREFL